MPKIQEEHSWSFSELLNSESIPVCKASSQKRQTEITNSELSEFLKEWEFSEKNKDNHQILGLRNEKDMSMRYFPLYPDNIFKLAEGKNPSELETDFKVSHKYVRK